MRQQALRLLLACVAVVSSPLVAAAETVPAPGKDCVFQKEGDEIKAWPCQADKDQPVTVRYLWLNATEVSFMLTGYSGQMVEGIFGKHPVVARNETYQTLENLYARYGSRLGNFNDYFVTHEVASGLSAEGTNFHMKQVPLGDMPTEVRQRFRLPTFEDQIVWPEIDFMAELKGGRWPTNFSYEYDFTTAGDIATKNGFLRQINTAAEKNQKALRNLLSQCMQFRRNLTKADWDNYGPSIDAMARKLETEIFSPWHVASDYLDHIEEGESDGFINWIADSEPYGFFSEIVADGMPDGFMWVRGTVATDDEEIGCNGIAGGLSFSVASPSLRVLVAVIASTSGDAIVTSGEINADKATSLRKRPQFSPNSETIDLGNVTLSKDEGRTLILPLQMGFTHREDAFSMLAEEPMSSELNALFAKYPDRIVKFFRCDDVDDGDGNDETVGERTCVKFLDMPLKAFPTGVDVVETEENVSAPEIQFTYGVAQQLTSLIVDGKSIFVRDAPTASLLASTGNSGEGSCPFVYFEMADSGEIRHGRILVGASSPDRMMTETLAVPVGAKRLIIKELEPEFSFISDVSFDVAAGGETARRSAASHVVLPPRTSFSIPIPDGASTVEIEGYYTLLSDMQEKGSTLSAAGETIVLPD